VVDRGGLENRCTLAGTQGSNPCLSADITLTKEQTTENQYFQWFFLWGKKQENAPKSSLLGCLKGGHKKKQKSLPFMII
jgi:hypothetical protein